MKRSLAKSETNQGSGSVEEESTKEMGRTGIDKGDGSKRNCFLFLKRWLAGRMDKRDGLNYLKVNIT